MAAGGSGHTLVLDGDGNVWSWGYNKYGITGDGTTVDALPHAQSTARRASLTDVVSIASGISFNIAVRSDGSIWTWGFGYLGHGEYEGRTSPTRVAGLINFKQAASGLYHVLALEHDGTVTAWGNNSRGAVGDGTNTHRATPVAIPLTDVTAVAASGHSLALKKDGTVWAWGENDYGQAGGVMGQHSATPARVNGIADVKAIAAGRYHSVALKQDGTVWSWGDFKALGEGTPSQTTGPVKAAISNVVAIAAGSDFSLALKDDGTVWMWGVSNYNSQGGATLNLAPWQVTSLAGVKAIGAGFSHAIAIAADGRVRTWGMNDVGQLGNGESGTISNTPVLVTGPSSNLALQSERASKAGVDRLFNWAESAFPDLLHPHAVSAWLDIYYYRCYASGVCLGEADGRVYLYQNNVLSDVGGSEQLLNSQAVPAGF